MQLDERDGVREFVEKASECSRDARNVWIGTRRLLRILAPHSIVPPHRVCIPSIAHFHFSFTSKSKTQSNLVFCRNFQVHSEVYCLIKWDFNNYFKWASIYLFGI